MQIKKRQSRGVFGFTAKQIIIFFLRRWSWFARRKLKKYEDIRKILVIRFGGGFGDLILITPALKSLRKKYPRAEITILTSKPHLAELLLHSGYIDPVRDRSSQQDDRRSVNSSDTSDNKKDKLNLSHKTASISNGVDKCLFFTIYDFYRWRKLFSVEFIRRFSNLLFRVRRENFDVLIDLHSLGQVSLISLIVLGSGAKYRIGLSAPHRSFLYHNSITYSDGVMNLKDWHLKVTELVGAKTTDSQTEISVGAETRQFTKDLLAKHNISDNDFLIVLHPGGGRPAKYWLPERFAELADKLISEYKIKIVLLGNDSEIRIARQVESAIKSPLINLAGKTGTLKHLAGVIARSNMFIGNDSGPMHLAIALKIPTIGIFGPAIKDYLLYENTPWYRYVRKEEIDNWPCWPCENYNCPDNRCLKLITVDDVFAATQQMLKSIGKEHG